MAESGLELLSEEIQGRGGKIYYKVIPYEFIYTDETTPQVLLSIDTPTTDNPGAYLDAVCAKLACGYTYVEPDAEVLTMTVSSLDVSFTGTSMPLDLTSVTIGYTDCVIVSSSDTAISCTLATPLFAGTWIPEIRNA